MSEPTNKKILIVDTDELLARILRHHFKEAGYETVIAKDVVGAPELIAREKPALVILELVMPDGSGFELLEKLRGQDFTKVVLTKLSQPEDRKRALDLGADLFFSKLQSSLKGVVDQILGLVS